MRFLGQQAPQIWPNAKANFFFQFFMPIKEIGAFLPRTWRKCHRAGGSEWGNTRTPRKNRGYWISEKKNECQGPTVRKPQSWLQKKKRPNVAVVVNRRFYGRLLWRIRTRRVFIEVAGTDKMGLTDNVSARLKTFFPFFFFFFVFFLSILTTRTELHLFYQDRFSSVSPKQPKLIIINVNKWS